MSWLKFKSKVMSRRQCWISSLSWAHVSAGDLVQCEWRLSVTMALVCATFVTGCCCHQTTAVASHNLLLLMLLTPRVKPTTVLTLSVVRVTPQQHCVCCCCWLLHNTNNITTLRNCCCADGETYSIKNWFWYCCSHKISMIRSII